MSAARNPIRDAVAIVGVGSTGFSRAAHGRSSRGLACAAAIEAIGDAGLTGADINGIVGPAEGGAPTPMAMAAALGIGDVSHFAHPQPVAMFALIDAANAIFSGACDTVLLYYAYQRLPWSSRSAAADPFRRSRSRGPTPLPESLTVAAAYPAWAGRYLHEYGASREDLGRVALNSRANAALNPLAAMRAPLDMDTYLAGRMISAPLCLYDMDVPVDGADAFVLTTTERARQLRGDVVTLHATALGLVDTNVEDQLPDLGRHGQHVVVESLRAKSEVWLDDVDVLFAYDGFTIITLCWLENLGYCKPGTAGRFLEEHWDTAAGSVRINGRVPLNPNGGSLSEGATRGSGQIREAVLQLRGAAGERQVADARTALLACGGFFMNSQGAVLRRL